ncbi:DivIVA domain-containing protein [Lactobacillus sp. Sy-1]|uniref:DivIVA domain-containing protein n=1 Tax=Lactobacillus sp. Sy-1 TaxID=2109645 RepID=UPI001C59BEE8|nr:DivIVA domain-containing protein [Lactobacillus sp. Sy-1]MBW1605419.1 DivIVA domain-containing protein [Lactobacillus sp. Sy-1]
MVLSPQDIHNKEFSIKMRGYNIDQVNDFLDQIIKDYQITIKQNEDLRSALSDTQAQLKQFNEMQNSLNQSILVAQQAADNVKNNANGEAQTVINNANQQASIIINNANQKANDITNNANQQANAILNNANQHSNQIVSESANQASALTSEINTLKKSTQDFRQKLNNLIQGQLELVQNTNWDKVLESSPDSYANEVINNLDKIQTESVKSNQDSNVNNNQINVNEQPLNFNSQPAYQPSDGKHPTIVYFPDGSTRQI